MENQTILQNHQENIKNKLLNAIKENSSLINDNEQLNKQLFSSQDLKNILQKSQNITNFSSLQSLKELSSQNGKLVKITSMIQDIAEIEMFASLYINKKQLKNPESLESSIYFNVFNIPSKNQEITEEFQPIFCDKQAMHTIPVPETSLVHQDIQNLDNIKNLDINNDNTTVRCGEHDISINKPLQQIQQDLQKSKVFNVNGNMTQFPAIINIYAPDENKLPKLHDIVDCYGILNFEIINTEDVMEMEEQLQYDQAFSNNYLNQYPVQIIPRIEVLHYEIQQDPLQQKLEQLKKQLNINENNQESLKQEVYNYILEVLKEVCMGDEIITHYLMISFIANTLFQKDGLNFGKFVVNLFKIPEVSYVYKCGNEKLRFSQVIDKIAQIVIPFIQSFPLSIEFLSSVSMAPFKNNESEKFEHGILQLPQNLKHLLVFDETYMESGNLNEKGVKNIVTLNKMLDSQILDVQSEYFNLQLAANVTGLILSEGKSFLFSDLKVCFKERAKNGELILSEKVQQILLNQDQQLRNKLQFFFLDSRLKLQNIDITEQAQKSIEKDYIDERQKQKNIDEQNLSNEEKITPDSLQRWIQLSKIVASYKKYEKQISTNEKQQVQASDYQYVRYLENERILRLKK